MLSLIRRKLEESHYHQTKQISGGENINMDRRSLCNNRTIHQQNKAILNVYVLREKYMRQKLIKLKREINPNIQSETSTPPLLSMREYNKSTKIRKDKDTQD